MAVVASTYAISSGVTSFTIARPGVEDASGDLYVMAQAFLSDGTSSLGFSSDTGGFRWAQLSSYSRLYRTNRLASYGHYIWVHVRARLGQVVEQATQGIVVTNTVAKGPVSVAWYRISNPLSTTTATDNIGSVASYESLLSTTYGWPGLTLVGNGSILIDVGAMLTATDPNAASLKLRTGDTETIIHRIQETDAGGYWLAGAHGYRESQTGVLANNLQSATGNLGGRSMAVEIRQSAGSGGGPPLPPYASVGRTMWIGA